MLCPSCFHHKQDVGVCPDCGFNDAKGREPHFLPCGHSLRQGRYVVGQILGKKGGFGVAYKALDTRQGAVVVIKECLLTESKQVSREPGIAAVQVNKGFEAEYRRWLDRFRVEAATIARFTSPYIVRVRDVFEENNTAYYVMPYVEGEDLIQFCAQHGRRLSEDEVTRFAVNLLSALSEMHAAGVVHRDIKPSNVLITRNRRKPVLIDFGAARDHFDDERSLSHMQVHSPLYAPLEQVQMREDQGPWTDIYSLCATLHYCLVSEPPPRVTDRFDPEGRRQDPFIPLHQREPQFGARLVSVIDNGLALWPQQRLRSATTAIRILDGDTIPSKPPVTPATPSPPDPPDPTLPQPLRAPAGPATAGWLGWLPSVGIVAWGLLAHDGFIAFISGVPALLIVGNGVAWAVWYANRRSLPFTAHGSPGTTGLGPSTIIQPPGNSVAGVELRLHIDGQPPTTRQIRAGQTLTLGRTNKSDLVVPNPLLSGRHVAIEVMTDGEFKLDDLDSLNHVYMHRRDGQDDAGSWDRIGSARGRKGRFALGPHDDGGVVIEIRQTTIET